MYRVVIQFGAIFAVVLLFFSARFGRLVGTAPQKHSKKTADSAITISCF